MDQHSEMNVAKVRMARRSLRFQKGEVEKFGMAGDDSFALP